MKALVKPIGGLLLVLLLFLCIGYAAAYAGQGDLGRQTRVIQNESSFGSKQAYEMQEKVAEEKNPVPFTLWKELKEQRVENPEYMRSTKVNTVLLCGSAALLFKGAASLGTGDSNGCLISAGSAKELFGGEQVVGRKLKYLDRELTVRGIIKMESPLLVLEIEADSKVELDQLTVEILPGEREQAVTADFANRHGTANKSSNPGIYTMWARAGTLILPVMMGLCILVPLAKACWKVRCRLFVCVLLLLLFLGAVLVLLWMIRFRFFIPEEYIPGKWSDFDFWTLIFEKKRDTALFLLGGEKRTPDLFLITPMLQSLKFTAGSLLLFFFCHKTIIISEIKSLYFYSVYFLLLSFGVSALLGQSYGWFAADSRILWLGMLFYVWGRFGVLWVQRKVDAL